MKRTKFNRLLKTLIFMIAVVVIVFLVQKLRENNLPKTFFNLLLGVDNFKIDNICKDDQITDTENGVRNEVFHINNENFASFLKSDLKGIPKKNRHASSFDSVLTWRTTPIKTEDKLIIDLDNLPWKTNNCFKKNDLDSILLHTGNYYAAFYNQVVQSKEIGNTFQWYIIDSKTHYLYVITSQ